MDLLHRKAQSYKFSNKNVIFCAWRDFNKTFCGISTYHKWMFKLLVSSIFNFDRAQQSWISGLLGVKPPLRIQIRVPVLTQAKYLKLPKPMEGRFERLEIFGLLYFGLFLELIVLHFPLGRWRRPRSYTLCLCRPATYWND